MFRFCRSLRSVTLEGEKENEEGQQKEDEEEERKHEGRRRFIQSKRSE